MAEIQFDPGSAKTVKRPGLGAGTGELDLIEQSRVRKLAPTESDYIGKKGYKRKYREDGSYEWRYRYQPNEGGKLTREAHEVGEQMAPFIRADSERMAKRQAAVPKVKIKDGDGQVRYLEPGLAETTVAKNGWSHAWRAGGDRIEVGLEGMLWRDEGGSWVPTGRWCMTRPHDWARVPQGGRRDGTIKLDSARDPDGNLWERYRGKWGRM